MKNFPKRNVGFFLLLTIACFTLVYSSTNVTRSKLTYESELYKGGVTVDNIGISLYENGNFVARRDNVKIEDEKNPDNAWDRRDNDGDFDSDGVLFSTLLGSDRYLKLGHKYKEELTVRNSGAIPQYCRLIIRKYWQDDTDETNLTEEERKKHKRVELDPSLIELELNLEDWNPDTSWSVESNSPETIILYYPHILGVGKTTPPATRSVTVNGLAAASVHTSTTDNPDGSTTVRTLYDYDGQHFVIEVEADAVQTHNAQSAMTSAWGVSYPVDGQ